MEISKNFIGTSKNHLAMDEEFLTDKVYDIFKDDMVVHDDKNFHNDKTNDWRISILYNDEHGQFIGRSQYPPSINQNLFNDFERQVR